MVRFLRRRGLGQKGWERLASSGEQGGRGNRRGSRGTGSVLALCLVWAHKLLWRKYKENSSADGSSKRLSFTAPVTA